VVHSVQGSTTRGNADLDALPVRLALFPVGSKAAFMMEAHTVELILDRDRVDYATRHPRAPARRIRLIRACSSKAQSVDAAGLYA